MQKLFLVLHLALFFTAQLLAQNPVRVDLLLTQATLGKGIPTQSLEQIDRQLLTLLADGESVNSQFSAFLVQPALDLLEEGKIEGMENRQTAKLNLHLKLVNAFTKEVLDARMFTLTGAGASMDDAVKKAVANIRRSNPALTKSMSEFRQKAADFYAKNCAAVTLQADDSARKGNYREAFSILHSVPQGVPCFAEVAAKKEEFFQKLQQYECAANLAKAQAAEAKNDFAGALAILSRFDPAAPCFEEVKKSIAAIEQKVDEQQRVDYEWLFKFYSEGKEAEAAKWNAMSALFMNWLKESGKYLIVNQ